MNNEVLEFVTNLSLPTLHEIIKAKATSIEAQGEAFLLVSVVLLLLAGVFFLLVIYWSRDGETSGILILCGTVFALAMTAFLGIGLYYYVGHEGIAVRSVMNAMTTPKGNVWGIW